MQRMLQPSVQRGKYMHTGTAKGWKQQRKKGESEIIKESMFIPVVI